MTGTNIYTQALIRASRKRHFAFIYPNPDYLTYELSSLSKYGVSLINVQNYNVEPSKIIMEWATDISNRETETCNRQDSQVVTHSSTSRPIRRLCTAERTGCPLLTCLESGTAISVDSAWEAIFTSSTTISKF